MRLRSKRQVTKVASEFVAILLGTGASPVGKRDPPQQTKFSGNGIAVASMCADLHQYCPVLATEGGHWQIDTTPGF